MSKSKDIKIAAEIQNEISYKNKTKNKHKFEFHVMLLGKDDLDCLQKMIKILQRQIKKIENPTLITRDP